MRPANRTHHTLHRLLDYFRFPWYNSIMSHQGITKYIVKDAPADLGDSKLPGFFFHQRILVMADRVTYKTMLDWVAKIALDHFRYSIHDKEIRDVVWKIYSYLEENKDQIENAVYARERLRSISSGKVERAKRNGLLKEKPCVICGKTNVIAHHEDYLYPLRVVWLCESCHVKVHSRHRRVFKNVFKKKVY